MKPILFSLAMAFLFFSCKKDIKLKDERNDCENFDITMYDMQGNVVGVYTKDGYYNSLLYLEGQDYCEFIEKALDQGFTYTFN